MPASTPKNPDKNRSAARRMTVYQQLIFGVPRFGCVEFTPQGDYPMRKTRQWRVEVRHSSPLRHTDLPYVVYYPETADNKPAKYPNCDLARFYMLQAIATCDHLPADHYSSQDLMPPVTPRSHP